MSFPVSLAVCIAVSYECIHLLRFIVLTSIPTLIMGSWWPRQQRTITRYIQNIIYPGLLLFFSFFLAKCLSSDHTPSSQTCSFSISKLRPNRQPQPYISVQFSNFIHVPYHPDTNVLLNFSSTSQPFLTFQTPASTSRRLPTLSHLCNTGLAQNC